MTTQTLKLKTGIVNNNDLQQRMFRALVYSVGFLMLCYVFLLGHMVYNIVARKNLETHARTLTTEVSTLELRYLALSSNVNLTLAHSLGFNESTQKAFTKATALGSLTLTQNEL